MTYLNFDRLPATGKTVATLAAGFFALVACDRTEPEPSQASAPSSDAQWTDIERSLEVDIAALNAAEPGDPAAIRTRVYRLSNSAYREIIHNVESRPTPGPTDPFAAAEPEMNPKWASSANPVRHALEQFGVDFPTGTDAVLAAGSDELIVTHNLEGFELVEAILQSLDDSAEKLVHLRVEVFQLPAPLTIELGESAAANADHTPEWEAVDKLVSSGDATLVDTIGTHARSGNRARVTSHSEHIHVAKFDWFEESQSMQPALETRDVGTSFEVDPVIGADNRTLNVNFLFEHHSAPPTEGEIEARIPKTDQFLKVPTPVFHAHQIRTQIEMTAGATVLLGTWRPTGRPEFERDDLMHVAFLKAEIQTVGGVQRIR